MNVSIYLLKKTYKISKNYSKIHEKGKIAILFFQILPSVLFLHMGGGKLPKNNRNYNNRIYNDRNFSISLSNK